MSKHKGEHPRMGATDVCPLIPIANISMEETAKYAQQLAKRVGEELNLPVYLYEAAATRPERTNLENIRRGQYEGIKSEIETDPNPDKICSYAELAYLDGQRLEARQKPKDALDAYAVAVAHALVHHAAQRSVDIAVVQQVVGDFGQQRVGVEVEPSLGAVPA